MGRFCYCTKILPGKTDLVRTRWKNKDKSVEELRALDSFWMPLKMTGFEAWLQQTPQGDFLIHCLEGESLQQIFKGLREQIALGNTIAVKLRDFYQEVLGKNYSLPEIEPHIESMLDISLPTSSPFVKRGFFYPLLSDQEEGYRHFRKEAMGEKRGRHEASMRAFGVSRLSTWLQKTPEGNLIVVYTERHAETPTSSTARLGQGEGSQEWQEIASNLMRHTGLKLDELSPDVEWLTQPK